MNQNVTHELVDTIKQAQHWVRESGFPQNRTTRQLRESSTFKHGEQVLPNAHRTANPLCEVMAGCIFTQSYHRTLEIGTLFGYSTLHLAEAAKLIGGHVTSVDLRVKERKWQDGQIVRDIHVAAEHHLSEAGLAQHVTLLAGRSEQILCDLVLKKEAYDLIFIDGSHSRYVVTLDILNALNLISPSGLIFFDDVSAGIAVKDFHHGGPNSILPPIIASGRFATVLLSANTLVLKPREAG